MTPSPTTAAGNAGDAHGATRIRSVFRRRAGVRMRSTLAASVVVAFALALGGAALIVLLRRSLTNGVDDAALLRARDIAVLLRAGSLPTTVATVGHDASVVQVVSPAGKVLASSANIVGEQPLTGLRPTGTRPVIETVHDLSVGPGGQAFRVVALRVSAPAGDYLVYVATSTSAIDQTIATTSTLLWAGLPLLLLIATLSTWAAAGRALRPVEAIRARTASITGSDLAARVPEPGTHDEVARLAATMNDMLTRLEQAAEQQRRFSADAAHELRTPLATLRARAEVALAHPQRTDWTSVTRLVLTEAEAMTHLINDLLLLARADAHQLAPHYSEVDIDGLVLSEAARLREHHTRHITLTAVEPIRMLADPAHLARVLSNLGDNAERHARSLIQLSMTQTTHQVQITIADDGPGIPAHQQHAIFERFTRLDKARGHDHGGTGLGLAIAEELATAHGGDLRLLASGPLSGACFALTLPLAESGDQPRTQRTTRRRARSRD